MFEILDDQHWRRALPLWCLCASLVACSMACSGSVSNSSHKGGAGVQPSGPGQGTAGTGANTANAGSKGGPGGSNSNASPGAVTAPDAPFEMRLALSAARKVKNLLTGLAPTDAEVAKLTKSGAAGLQELISTWITDSASQPLFREKMLFFFRNHFQQVGFTPTEDFKMQLLQNGGFDFGGFGLNAVGDDAFQRLVQNLEDSFALTAWQLVSDGRPFSETLTTRRYMMTTGLKSLYLQIEMPADAPFGGGRRTGTTPPLAWKIDYSGNPIPFEQTLDPSSPNYMLFDDQPPAMPTAFQMRAPNAMNPICRGGTTLDAAGAAVTVGTFSGHAQLFQRLLGHTPRFGPGGMPTCTEHASKPYFTQEDLSDWQWVDTRPLNNGEARLMPYDLPVLRKAKELALTLPRIGFYTTPAFLALWNTNDSNQHRVTANQTLLVALGQSFTSESAIIPLSTTGLDSGHATTGSECYGCHKSLDPMRTFWGNQYDFNDRNDFPTRGFMMTAANPRPSALGGVLAFADINAPGATMLDLGGLLAKATDGGDKPLTLFATALTQKLCFYANSTACDAEDPEFIRVVRAFQDGNDSFLALVKELFASPLVTGAGATKTFAKDTIPLSIERRDHLCAALSNRLGKPDLCAFNAPIPTSAQAATAKIASSVAADAFSRGAESPITSADPTMFYRAATEMLCENIANQVVDGTINNVFSSAEPEKSVLQMVEQVMGYPPASPSYGPAADILAEHYGAVLAQNRNGQAIALRSTFVLACESPTALAVGL